MIGFRYAIQCDDEADGDFCVIFDDEQRAEDYCKKLNSESDNGETYKLQRIYVNGFDYTLEYIIRKDV